MQHLNLDIIKAARKAKVRELEEELRAQLSGAENKESILCPFCQYTNSKGVFSGRVFKSGDGLFFKCFSCGVWRKL